LIYIPKKEAQLQQKGFRILKEYGSNMFDKQKYFETHFKNYGIFYSIKEFNSTVNILNNKNGVDTVKLNQLRGVVNSLQQYVKSEKIYKSSDSSFIQNNGEYKILYRYQNKELDNDLIDLLTKVTHDGKRNVIDTLWKYSYIHAVPIVDFMNGLKYDQLFENMVLFNDSNVFYNSRLDKLVDITNPEAMCDSTKKTQGGIYKKLKISGENKHVLTMPIDFLGSQYYIAGFISDTDYRNKTHAINKQFLIFIASLILMLFVGTPILKIIFIDPQERITASDATSAFVSLLFGIGLFTIIITGFSKKLLIDKGALNNRIESISGLLVKNVMHDLDSLKVLGSSIAKKNTVIPFIDTIISKLETGTSFRDKNLSFPFPLNEILLIKSDGIVQNAYRSTPFTDLVKTNLNERMYFRNIIKIENSWPHTKNDSLNFYIESIKSLNTGAVETAISFNTSKFGDSKVLAITSKIPSLYNQVLPKDIEFVIINNTGKVLYHSMEEKILHEYFTEECDRDTRLIKSIINRKSATIMLDYNEDKWLARVVPIDDTPLYHITLLDLTQTGNKNARIFLFTFYFMFTSLLLAGIIIFTICSTKRIDNGLKKNTWYFNWLVLENSKYHLYTSLIYLLTIFAFMQLMGTLVVKNPIPGLFYQLIYICCSFFISFLFLSSPKKSFKELIGQRYIRFALPIFLIFIIILTFCLIKFNSTWYFSIPLIVFLLLVVSVPFYYDYVSNQNSENISLTDLPKHKIKNTYLVFLFLWFTNMAAIPVVQYYLNVKHQEEVFWKMEQKNKVAKENIVLLTDDKLKKHHNENWFKNVQGNEIDFMEVSESEYKRLPKDSLCIADRVYISIPDPVSNWNNQPRLSNESYINTSYNDDSLVYMKGLQKGSIIVKHNNNKHFPAVQYLLLIILILIIVLVCVWFVLKYLASIILNLHQEKTEIQELTWFEILKNKKYNRVLLHSFDGDCYLSESKKPINTHFFGYEAIKTIQASHIISSGFKIKSLLNSTEIIWITGLKQILLEVEKHEQFLSVLNKLNQKCNNRIIVDMAFDTGFINEFYDEFVDANALPDEELTKIFILRKKWNNLFNGYFEFDGYLNLDLTNKPENKKLENGFADNCKSDYSDSRFSDIWSNLTSYEKIFLFDLAEDGLLNRKNKNMMRRMVSKRLINPEPYPALFSEEFKAFIHHSMKTSERKEIERKLGIKKSGQNTKNLILFIVVPLTAFILISQGLSIEKIVGIFAGGLTVVGGLMRLLDSSNIKQSSS